jgi:hypothetical protein
MAPVHRSGLADIHPDAVFDRKHHGGSYDTNEFTHHRVERLLAYPMRVIKGVK